MTAWWQCPPTQSWHVEPVPPMTAELDGVEFTSVRTDPPVFGITDWAGWTEPVEGRGGPETWPHSDGGPDGRVDWSGRAIHLEGIMRAHDMRELWHMKEEFTAILTRNRAAWLRIDEELLDLSRQVWVQRLASPQVTIGEDRRSAIWTLDLVAAGYRRLAVQQSSLLLSPGQSGTMVNEGGMDAALSAVIKGPLTGLKVMFGSQQWEYIDPIASGQEIGIDFSGRYVRNSSDGLVLRYPARGAWPQLAPGSTSVQVLGSGGGSVELRWRSSWH